MFQQVDFSALDLPPSARALQREVREFLREEMAAKAAATKAAAAKTQI